VLQGTKALPHRRFIYCALSPTILRQERGKHPAVGKLLIADGHHQPRQLHYTRLTPTLSSFYTRASHGRAHLWHLRCRHRAYGHWTLYVWGLKSWDGKDQGLTRIADMLFNGEGEAFNVRIP
jgi:hypothetical protein